jgi:hypothetical protein
LVLVFDIFKTIIGEAPNKSGQAEHYPRQVIAVRLSACHYGVAHIVQLPGFAIVKM